ncbi:MAG: PaaI family thioesterase [Anaerolineales bacterium]
MPILDKEAWLALARAAHARTAFGLLGGELVDVDERTLTVRLPITDAVRQPYGMLHGGISLFLIETAASSHAAYGVDLGEAQPVGVEINGSHLRSATEGTLRAVARVIRRGRTHIVHEVDVVLEESGELLCRGRMTNYYKEVGE